MCCGVVSARVCSFCGLGGCGPPAGLPGRAAAPRSPPGIPLGRAAASSRAASAQGYLALLRRWVRLLEAEPYRREALRSLIAPEMDANQFAAAVAEAEQEEQRCAGATARAAAP